MGVVVPEGFAQVVYRHTLTGDPEEMLVTMGHVWAPATTDQALINDLFDAWKLNIKPGVTAGLTFVGATAYIGQTGADSVVVQSNTATDVGTTSGTSAPSNTAGLVRKNTALAGRHGKGRFYMPGITMNGVSVNGAFNGSGLQTSINTWFALFAGIGSVGGSDPVLLHSEGSGIAPTTITSFTVQSKIATQRRRLRP